MVMSIYRGNEPLRHRDRRASTNCSWPVPDSGEQTSCRVSELTATSETPKGREDPSRASEALDSPVSLGSLAMYCLVLLHRFKHQAGERTHAATISGGSLSVLGT